MTRIRLFALLSVLIALSACSVGPRYTKPQIPTPPAYREDPPDQFKEAGVWQAAQPADAFARGEWWRIFDDHDLDDLESRIDISNQTLKAAEARFREARALVGAARSSRYPTVGVAPAITGNTISSNRGLVAPARVSY